MGVLRQYEFHITGGRWQYWCSSSPCMKILNVLTAVIFTSKTTDNSRCPFILLLHLQWHANRFRESILMAFSAELREFTTTFLSLGLTSVGNVPVLPFNLIYRLYYVLQRRSIWMRSVCGEVGGGGGGRTVVVDQLLRSLPCPT
jgi:hypothetical protein